MADNNVIRFFTAQTANATSAPFVFSGSNGTLKVWGTWDGANIALYTGSPGNTTNYISVSIDNIGTPLVLSDNSNTYGYSIGIENIVQNETLVAILTDAGGSTSLNLTLQKVHV
jgi:hypothetical protein